MFADPLGYVSGGALGESAELLAKGKERELLTALFWIVQSVDANALNHLSVARLKHWVLR
jgi:hypothetical protein